MFVASSSIELDEFEQVEAAPGTALLRVAARPAAGTASEEAATLVVDDGVRRHRLSPLPAPPGPPGLLRAAYSAPLELLNGRTAFTLELPDGSVVDLPAPTTRRKPLVHGERRLAIDELERRLQAERDRRASAEAQMANAAAAEAEATSRLAELEVDQQAAIAELADAIEDAQERLLTAGRALAEERARAAAELEQARAATAQAERHAVEQERGRTEAEEHARSTEVLADERADLQRLAETRLAAAIEAHEAARAELGAAHETALRREEALNDAEREAHVAAAERATEVERLEQAMRTESERRAQLSERVGGLVAELAALAAARTGAEEAVTQLRDELETALAERARAEAEAKAQRAAARETKLEAIRLAAEARAQEQAQAEVEAALRGRPKTRAAEPPQSIEQAAADDERPRRVRDREAAPAQARTSRAVSPRVSAGRAARRARVRRRLASLPSQVVLGMCLLTLGLIVAVLFLTGEVKVGFAP